MVERVKADAHTELSRARWGRAIHEASMDWVTYPAPLGDAVLNRAPLPTRFANEEQHGAGKRKIRFAEDFKASQINDLLGMVDTSVPETLDVFLAMLLTQGHHNPTADLLAFSVDFARAYKQVGITEDRTDFATVELADHAGVPHIASLKTQPFGLRRAPANWRGDCGPLPICPALGVSHLGGRLWRRCLCLRTGLSCGRGVPNHEGGSGYPRP